MCSSDLKVITVRTTAFDAVGTGGAAVVEALGAAADTGQTQLQGRELTKSERPELGAAKIIVSGGRGLGGPEPFKTLQELCNVLGAALGASRAAVDAGWIHHTHQVGQTGKVVSPDLYIACGISGAIQHKVGMQNSGVIVAINKDKNAPIFDYADFGVVGDLHDVVPKLTELIRARG